MQTRLGALWEQLRAGTAFAGSFALLREPRFATFWAASLLSNIGTWTQNVAQPWLLLSLGASPFLLGLDSFAMSGPTMALTVIGGILADRADRRRIIAIFQSVQMFCPILIVVLLSLGIVRPWMIILLSLVVGATDALSMPSFQTILPTLVERDEIPAAQALNVTQFNLSRILGPAVAGILLASIGAAGCFAVNALSYVPFILIALWMLPRKTIDGDEAAEHFRTGGLLDGVRQIGTDDVLRRSLLTVLATSALCAPLVTFTPVIVRDVFIGTSGDFSLALGAFGIGGLLGAVALLGVSPAPIASVSARRSRRPMASLLFSRRSIVGRGLCPCFSS